MSSTPATASVGRTAAPAHQDHWWRVAARTIGQLSLTVGVLILLFVVYELWWTGFTTQRDQHELLGQLQKQWSAPAPPAGATTTYAAPKIGSGIAILRIPKFGSGYKFVIVQGTSTADLIKGPGHYVGSAMPGQVGNFAVAGHRTTYLHPFYDIGELHTGDPIVIETRSTWWVYDVSAVPGTTAKAQEIVDPTDLSVAYPVPDQPNPHKKATQKTLTFTSCNPKYSAVQRIVIHGVLVSSSPVADGPPAVLKG